MSVIIWDKIGEDKKFGIKKYNVISSRKFSVVDIDFEKQSINIQVDDNFEPTIITFKEINFIKIEKKVE